MESNWIEWNGDQSLPKSDLPRQFGSYTLLQRLAVGGMAEVYVARSSGTAGFEKLVALKVIHPKYSRDQNFVSMLIEEAKLSVLLNHRNIVQTFDLGHIEDGYFIVMEHVEGYDAHHVLRTLRARNSEFPIDLAGYVVAEVCRGLDYAHRRADDLGRPLHIVHRDVSPQNVLLSFAGEVKIGDFGIAKVAYRTTDTEAGVIKGKYFYMSPEQAWGDPVDHRSDVFSAGVVLWELLAGETLYKPGDVRTLLASVRKADIPPPSSVRREVPKELDAIVARAAAAGRDDRYPTAGDLAEALTRFLADMPPTYAPGRLADMLAGIEPPTPASSSPALVPPTVDRAITSDTSPGDLLGRDDFGPTAVGRRFARRGQTDEASTLASDHGSPPAEPDDGFDVQESIDTVVGRRTHSSKRATLQTWRWPLLSVAALVLALAVYAATR